MWEAGNQPRRSSSRRSSFPIVTPRAIASPLLQVRVRFVPCAGARARPQRPCLPDPVHPGSGVAGRAQWRNDRVLTIVAERQHVDWRSFRYFDVNSSAFGQEIGRFCEKIAETLHEPWVSPEERAGWRRKPGGAPRKKSAFGRKPRPSGKLRSRQGCPRRPRRSSKPRRRRGCGLRPWQISVAPHGSTGARSQGGQLLQGGRRLPGNGHCAGGAFPDGLARRSR